VTWLWDHLFGEDHDFKERRSIVHDNKNEAQKSIASAIQLTKASREAERIAKCAIQKLEEANHKKKDE